MTRRLLIILLIGSIAGVAVAVFNPVNSFGLRLLLLSGIAGTFLSLFALTHPLKRVRVVIVGLLVVTLAPLLLLSREVDRLAVREDYLDRLVQLDSVPYHWGGESAGGIDCSGLPGKTLRGALFWNGLKTGNGKPIRAAVSQWWNDASAKAISEGYRDYATKLETEGSIAKMSYDELKPGDLAVSIGGVHVLVYLGDEQWIQAAPEVGHVAIFDGRKDDNRWLKVAVTTHRWNVFDERKFKLQTKASDAPWRFHPVAESRGLASRFRTPSTIRPPRRRNGAAIRNRVTSLLHRKT